MLIVFGLILSFATTVYAKSFCCSGSKEECCAEKGKMYCPQDNSCRTKCLEVTPSECLGGCVNPNGGCCSWCPSAEVCQEMGKCQKIGDDGCYTCGTCEEECPAPKCLNQDGVCCDSCPRICPEGECLTNVDGCYQCGACERPVPDDDDDDDDADDDDADDDVDDDVDDDDRPNLCEGKEKYKDCKECDRSTGEYTIGGCSDGQECCGNKCIAKCTGCNVCVPESQACSTDNRCSGDKPTCCNGQCICGGCCDILPTGHYNGCIEAENAYNNRIKNAEICAPYACTTETIYEGKDASLRDCNVSAQICSIPPRGSAEDVCKKTYYTKDGLCKRGEYLPALDACCKPIEGSFCCTATGGASCMTVDECKEKLKVEVCAAAPNGCCSGGYKCSDTGCCAADKLCGTNCCPDGQECKNGTTCCDIIDKSLCPNGETMIASNGCEICKCDSCPTGQECHPKTGQCVDTYCVSLYKEVYNSYKNSREYDVSTLKQVPTLHNNGCCFDENGRMWSDEECGLYTIAYMIYSNNEKQFVQCTQHVCAPKPCSISDYGD